MKQFTLCIALAALTLIGAAAQSSNPDKPVSCLSWLVGGVWTADASKMGPGMQRIETRYRWSDNNSYLRFTTHFVTDKAVLKTYDGNFYWDPAKKELSMRYMDTKNEITQGPMTIDVDRWLMHFHGEDFEGKQADLYRWSLAEKQGESWKQLAALDYARQP